ncbi:hypothetical protein [Endozoicomonas atrinae]|uniref:hypothetical protein n=1 Tax=Endozoicomonas atrinae TaxID=1333660 RepID=UPI000824E247|nr:hypothetical protein [Endozoicomonas atrinae]
MSPIHPDYDQLRADGRDLNSKLFKELNKDEHKIAARQLGAMKKNQMMFDSYEQFDQFTDFCINDFQDIHGHTIVSRYLSRHADTINATEEKILNALLSSNTSLYRIVSRNIDSSTVTMEDLLNGGELTITDRGFSLSPNIVDYVMFTRILSYEDGLNFTSGAPMIFPKSTQALVLSEYWRLLKKRASTSIPSRRYAAFYKLHDKYGYKAVSYDETAGA